MAPPFVPVTATRRSAQRLPVPLQNVRSSSSSASTGNWRISTVVRRTTQPSSPRRASRVSSLETSWRYSARASNRRRPPGLASPVRTRRWPVNTRPPSTGARVTWSIVTKRPYRAFLHLKVVDSSVSAVSRSDDSWHQAAERNDLGDDAHDPRSRTGLGRRGAPVRSRGVHVAFPEVPGERHPRAGPDGGHRPRPTAPRATDVDARHIRRKARRGRRDPNPTAFLVFPTPIAQPKDRRTP